MSNQSTDEYGAADFLKITVATVRRRIKAGTFPAPDAVESNASWWELATLDKYQKALKRREYRRAAKRRLK